MVLLAAAPLQRLFLHSGGEDQRDRQLLDDLGLSEVRPNWLRTQLTMSCFLTHEHKKMFFFLPIPLPRLLSSVQEAAEHLTLFTAEEEIFAFQRTVSRLVEMQTEAYWMEGDHRRRRSNHTSTLDI